MNTKEEITVSFNLLNDDKKEIHGFLPERIEELSTGYDVRNAGPDLILKPLQKALIPLGFRAIIPSGWFFEIYPRSSTFHKKSIHSLYGVVDESYENYWYFACQYIPESRNICREDALIYDINYTSYDNIKIKHGDRIAQIVLRKRYSIDNIKNISDEEFKELVANRGAVRGLGGFGSSGDQ